MKIKVKLCGEKCSRCKLDLVLCICSKSHTTEINSLVFKTDKTPDYDKVMDEGNNNYKSINTEFLNLNED